GRGFDLARGPLVRAALVRLGREDHVLLLALHHIVTDGWSMGVLLREVAVLYRAFAARQPSPLPPLGVQYADFAAWQREWLTGETLATQLAYWREALAGAPAVLELPADRPRPAVQTFRGGTLPFRLPPELTAALHALARRQGVTLFMTLLAGVQALLHRLTGREDLLLGSPIANRNRAEIEGLIGFFVNTLVLRGRPQGEMPFEELLARAGETTLEAYAHQDLPFEKVVEHLQPRRELSHAPLFQILVLLQNAPIALPQLPGLTVEPFALAGKTAKFDLTLAFVEGRDAAGGLLAAAEFATDLFDGATVQRLLGHLSTLLEGAVADPAARLADLPLLSAVEREQVVVAWNRTATAYPREATVHALFTAQARRTPDAVAVACGGETLSYAELDARAERLAARLRALGVGPEIAVGLCVERSLELAPALLGILKAGGFYVPLDPQVPRERLAFMVEEVRAAVLVTQEHLAGLLPDRPGCVRVLVPQALGGEEAPAQAGAGGDAANLAYVMYTSGSTGRPKGVAVSHRNVVRLVQETDYVHFGPDEVFLQFAPVSFDAATLEIWGPLLNGGRLVIFPPGPASLEELGEAIAREGVTTLWLTAGLFHRMVERHLERLRPLRQLLAGGDVLSSSHVRRALAGLPGVALINGYGPTEGTTFTCCHSVRTAPVEGAGVPIGRPIANSRAYVLDGALRPVPVGAVGELYASGDGLARGYFGRPGLTAECFVPDPVSAEPGARLYRTGDLARWLPGGELEFLGRIDDQIKLRGFRIELREIETALAVHPAVREAVVLAREEEPGEKALVAYVVPVGAGLEVSELRFFLAQRLPDYMVPSAFVLLEALPLTPNGKVDRKALPAPVWERVERPAAPRTWAEELLADIWAEVLRLPAVGPEDDFFAVGGHSLLATQVVSRVREVFGLELPLRKVFELPTLAALAAHLETWQRQTKGAAPSPIARPAWSSPAPIDRRAWSGPAPASFAQERLWFLEQLGEEGASYVVPVAWRLRGRLDRAALAAALQEIVRRHEALRTTFLAADALDAPAR
ncbi:MAG TPA: amino acid adenylation domain-containing protein, partial [Thermoanaerobaculia bacterium]